MNLSSLNPYATKIKLAVGAIVLLTLVVGFFYIKTLRADVALKAEQLHNAETVIALQKANLADLNREIKDAEQASRKLQIEFAAADARARELTAVFYKHDLAKLLKAKPGLLTTRMRAASANVWLLLEKASSYNYIQEDNLPSGSSDGPSKSSSNPSDSVND